MTSNLPWATIASTMLLPIPLEPPATAMTDMMNVIEMEVIMRGVIAWYWNLSVQEGRC